MMCAIVLHAAFLGWNHSILIRQKATVAKVELFEGSNAQLLDSAYWSGGEGVGVCVCVCVCV